MADDVVLVTGAGSGIGRAIAIRLAARGRAVAVNDLLEQRAADVVEAITSTGGVAHAVPGDVSRSADVSRIVDRVLDEFGCLTHLVNNAGVVSFEPLRTANSHEWDRVLSVNLRAVALCCRAAFSPLAAAPNPAIINIASTAGLSPKPDRGPYPASKAGVIALTKQLALEWGPHGIRVNAIAPGRIAETGMTRGRGTLEAAKHTRHVPLERVGRPEDVAGVSDFLLSRDADFMTGAVVVVDGGLSLAGPGYQPHMPEH